MTAASVNFSGKIPLVTTTIHYRNTPCFSLALLELAKKNLETKKKLARIIYILIAILCTILPIRRYIMYYIHRYLK